jgi:hypothetical protein
MATSFGALCNDFYVNHKVALKMDLPGDRETLLHLFDRVRKSIPSMSKFQPFENELTLESSRKQRDFRCLTLRPRSIRTAYFNPPSMPQAYDFHKTVLELAPYHLSLSPLDIDYCELVFGFDLECKGNQDETVFEALYANTPLGELGTVENGRILDAQPFLNIMLDDKGSLQACFEVKTRNRSKRGGTRRYRHEPISLFLTVRKFGPLQDVKELKTNVDEISQIAEKLATEHFIPHLLTPVARHITSSSA